MTLLRRPWIMRHPQRPPRMQSTDDITRLVQRWSAGDADALEHLLPKVYAELRRLARIQLGKQQGHETLQATALVNDVLLKLIDRAAPQQLENRAHLYNTAARMMRQLLVDRARSTNAPVELLRVWPYVANTLVRLDSGCV